MFLDRIRACVLEKVSPSLDGVLKSAATTRHPSNRRNAPDALVVPARAKPALPSG